MSLSRKSNNLDGLSPDIILVLTSWSDRHLFSNVNWIQISNRATVCSLFEKELTETSGFDSYLIVEDQVPLP